MITLSGLFAPEGGATPNPLLRKADQPTWRDPASGYVRHVVSPPGTGSGVEIVDVTFPAGASVTLDGVRLAGADQHVWVLEGVLELHGLHEAVRLCPGDCFLMRFEHPVRFHNPTGEVTRYAVILHRGVPPR